MALCAGKHAFIETSAAETWEDAKAILKVGQQHGRRVFVDLFLVDRITSEKRNSAVAGKSGQQTSDLIL